MADPAFDLPDPEADSTEQTSNDVMNEVLAQVFTDRDAAHLAHLATQSFARHDALGDFYKDVIKKTDRLVEAAIGMDVGVPTTAEGDAETPSSSIEFLENGLMMLQSSRDDFCQGASLLENLYDDLMECYATTLFKLKRLIQ